MLTKSFQFLMVVLFIPLFVYSQREISGKIMDEEGNELPGVNIHILQSKKGTFSDVNGNFTLLADETDSLEISFVGFERVVEVASQIDDKIIHLKFLPLKEFITRPYYNTLTIGFLGDFHGLPYGITLHHFHPYLFKKTVLLSGQVHFKTDFNSNTDFKLLMNKSYIFDINHFSTMGTISFHSRNIYINEDFQINVMDYDFILRNNLWHFMYLSVGMEYRNNLMEKNKKYGGLIAIDKSLKTITQVGGGLSLYKNTIEFQLFAFQKFSNYKKIISRIQAGLAYQKYTDYDEMNLSLKYSFF